MTDQLLDVGLLISCGELTVRSTASGGALACGASSGTGA